MISTCAPRGESADRMQPLLEPLALIPTNIVVPEVGRLYVQPHQSSRTKTSGFSPRYSDAVELGFVSVGLSALAPDLCSADLLGKLHYIPEFRTIRPRD